jgi:exopolysaccharide production protein ExoZ
MVHHSLTAFGPNLTTVMVGSAGVDVFFVISGVVIGYMDHDDGVARFAIKRFIRVMPLYWLSTLVYGIFRYYFWHDIPVTGRILHSIFLVPDFSGEWVPIYYPAWTLSFELAFYILFGALLPIAGRRTALAASIIAIALSSLPIPVPFESGAFFGTPLFLEFGAGLLLAEAIRAGFRLPASLGVLCVGLGLAGFAARYGYPADLRPIQWGIPAFLLVLGTLSLEQSRIFYWRPLIVGGDASYALYLFHIPVMEGMVFACAALKIDLQSRFRFIALRELLLLGSALIVGLAIHRFIERPMLEALRKLLLGKRPAVMPATIGT